MEIMTDNDLVSFGAVLKSFRIHRQLTQQQLALAIGVHRNAISRWEQGDFLPASKATVLELAKRLRLSDQESRRLLEASLVALAPSWLVPWPRNPFFTGREEILETLHARLGVNQIVALSQSYALHGLGGVGKTQLALEYAYRYALEYNAVFWIGAETVEQIVADLLRIAEVLQLPGRDDKNQQSVVAAVQHWLTTHSQWLLIWDSVEDLDLLSRFLPAARQGVVLLTTRLQVLGTLAHDIDMVPMEHEEGMLFLLRRAKVLETTATSEQVRQLAIQQSPQYDAAAELVTAMGGLPLALDQAGAYLEETQCGLLAYLRLFYTRRAALLQQRGEGSLDHPASVSTTFMLALAATTLRHPAVLDLLRVCALLQPDAIPDDLFRRGGVHLGTALEAICCDALEWNKLIAIACAYSLLSRQPEEQTLSLHRLVQAVLLDAMTEQDRKQWLGRVIGALEAVFPEVLPVTEHVTWRLCESLLPHAMACVNRVEASEETLALASLAYKVARYLRERGRYAEAEPLLLRALQIRQQALESDHTDVTLALNALAILYSCQGKYAAAEPLFQYALSLLEQALGPDHLDVARPLNNLANLYVFQGKYMEAEPLYQRAMRISEQILGPDHLDVARPLNNLANLYVFQGRYAAAEQLYYRVLNTWEQALGSAHPMIAYSLNGLGNLFREQGKYTQAEALYQRSLHILEQILGPNHPLVAQTLNNLATLFRDQGKPEEAEPLYQRALRISEQSQDSDHPELAVSLNGLANLFREQGEYTQAEALYQRALSIREQYLGLHHPDTAQTLYELAIFRQKQGNQGSARAFTERALQIRTQFLGDTHPKTIATRTLFTQLTQTDGCSEMEATSEQRLQENLRESSFLTSPQVIPSSSLENDPLQAFLDTRCGLHPLAWSRVNDLWCAYEQWVEEHQEPFPLSRRAFAAQLKVHGCRNDRTRTSRIWRGIALVSGGS